MRLFLHFLLRTLIGGFSPSGTQNHPSQRPVTITTRKAAYTALVVDTVEAWNILHPLPPRFVASVVLGPSDHSGRSFAGILVNT